MTASRRAQDQHEDLGDDHDPDVDLEPRPDVRQRLPEVVGAEELLEQFLHRRPARYLKIGSLETSVVRYFLASFEIVPSAFQPFRMVLTCGSSLLPFSKTMPYCSPVLIWPTIGP